MNKYKAGVPHGAVYCGRGSPYGNPFVIGRDGDRDQVCEHFEREVLPTLAEYSIQHGRREQTG